VKAISLVRRAAAVTASAAALALTAAVAPATAHADAPGHYYIEVGGTGATPPAPHCTYSYDAANGALRLGSAAIPVCYPATAGPVIGTSGPLVDLGNGQVHPDALTAPSFDASVQQGYRNTLKAAEDTYHAHPNARITITGYSQGALVADQVLQTIAHGTDIPSSQVDGMLYADPMQPGTGLGTLLPKGVGIPGLITSPGAGPVDFGRIPVERYCLTGDPICNVTPTDLGGYVSQHPRYPTDVIPQTLGRDGGNGTTML
jgi:hypothetical protein